MIALEHSGWSGASLAFTTDSATAAYDFDTVYPGQVADLHSFSQSLASWLNDAARPWSTGFGLSLEKSATGVALRIVASSAFTYTANAAATSAAGLAGAAVATTDETGTAAALTLWPAAAASRTWLEWDKSAGVAAAGGAFLPSIPGALPRRPLFRFVLTELEAAQLTHALANATTPRRAALYQPSAAAWHMSAIGQVQPPRRVGNLYRAGFKVLS